MLTVGGLVLAYPLGVLLALGRRSQLNRPEFAGDPNS
jgi:hypothetical protein